MTRQSIAPGIHQLQPYVPGKPLDELERELGIRDAIKLASNENPLGPAPSVRQALSAAGGELARYPDGSGHALRTALAEHHQIAADWITLGNGSNDVLDMIARVFLYPGRESVFSAHAFAVYRLSSQAVGADLKVAEATDYGHDLNKLYQQITPQTGVVWIANPNNPTGTWLARDPLYDFIRSVPQHVMIVLDEAYIDYINHPDYPDGTQWLADHPNLIVTRTFSKAYGLAALRVGYALAHPEVTDLLNRVRQPFNVNSLAQAAALAALQDQAHIVHSADLNRVGLQQLAAGFKQMGLSYIPSVGNFITVLSDRPAAETDAALLRQGVITRPVENYGLPGGLRISVGLPEENTRCLQALQQVI
ncbi:MAG: histidinol-phosphate transaminase [Pseudomonadota bacterium]